MTPQAQAGEDNLAGPPFPSAAHSLQSLPAALLILECYCASVHWVTVECCLQASHSWKNGLVLRLPPQDTVLSVGKAEWSSGFFPWIVAAEVEGLSEQKVHLRLWVVGSVVTVEMTGTLGCAREKVV